MTQITEQTLEGYKKEIETINTRPEAESFLKGLTVKELKALYKYLYIYTYGEWYRMRKAEFIDGIIDFYFAPEVEEDESESENSKGNEFEESETEVQRVMDAITAVNYEPKAMREILKAQTENFRQAMLHIMSFDACGFWNEKRQIKVLIENITGFEDFETRARYIRKAALWIRFANENIEYCRKYDGADVSLNS